MNLICTLVHPIAVICIMQSHAMVMCYSVSILAGPALAYPSLGQLLCCLIVQKQVSSLLWQCYVMSWGEESENLRMLVSVHMALCWLVLKQDTVSAQCSRNISATWKYHVTSTSTLSSHKVLIIQALDFVLQRLSNCVCVWGQVGSSIFAALKLPLNVNTAAHAICDSCVAVYRLMFIHVPGFSVYTFLF